MYTLEQQRIGLKIQTALLNNRYPGKAISPEQFQQAHNDSMAVLDMLIEIGIMKTVEVDPETCEFEENVEWYGCPLCKIDVAKNSTYCPGCRATLDWNLVEEYDTRIKLEHNIEYNRQYLNDLLVFLMEFCAAALVATGGDHEAAQMILQICALDD